MPCGIIYKLVKQLYLKGRVKYADDRFVRRQGLQCRSFLIYWLVATVIAILVAYNIDPQKKLVWFRQRSDNGFMVRRGWFGNFSLLGVPRSKMGFAITAGIFIGAGIVWALLIFMILPVLGYHV